jgi:RND family efflux transporter MFP subunit
MLAALALFTSGCGEGVTHAKQPQPSTPSGDPVVAVLKPKSESLSKDFVFTGEFRPYQVADLHAKVAGYVREIPVDVGSIVQTGQVIATLEIPEMQADLATATADRQRIEAEIQRSRAEIQRAEANLKIQSLSYDRLSAAAKAEPGLVAQQEIDQAQALRSAAEAQLASSKAALAVEERRAGVGKAMEHKAQVMAAYSRIVAPFDGIVTKRYADVGAMIQAGTASQTQAMPLVRLAQINRLRLAVTVPESQVPMIRVGQQVQIKVSSINKTISGRVSRLTGDVMSNSRTMEAEIDVPNPANELKPGMYAEIQTNVARKDQALTIPVAAVMNSGGNRSVFVASPAGTLEERTIRTGMEGENSLEVLAGLTAQDLVVISNRTLLRPGQKVQAREAGAN